MPLILVRADPEDETVREAVMVDKVRQRAELIRTQLREEAEHRFHVHRASAGSPRRRRSTSGAFGP